VSQTDLRRRFDALVMPHLDAAYNLARWLTRDDHDAQDVTQEALMRALRHFAGFRGDKARPWLLQIVRHTSYTWLHANRPADLVSAEDAELAWQQASAPAADEPSAVALRNADRVRVNQAVAALPALYREVIVLREFEDLAYQDIARIAEVPVGTVMSRLARARALLRRELGLPARPAGARPDLREVPRPAQGGAKR
jgi:RNA polymerase sigma-70 factor, ECF subfamily